jgi:group I intron endonuclease
MSIYLYVKQCNHCGKKYFGKHSGNDPYKYTGSGKHWLRHLKKHKPDVNTTEVWGFDNQELATSFAKRFSEDNNIVNSEEWFNLVEEDALDGNSGYRHTQETKQKLSERSAGQNCYWFGKIHTEESLKKMRESKLGKNNPNFGKNFSTETRQKLHDANVGENNPNYGKSSPHRRKCTDGINVYDSVSEMSDYHNVVRGTCLYRIKSSNFPDYHYV